MFVNTMRGPLYSISYDGKTVTPYLDINAANGASPCSRRDRERGFQSFAFHPQFSQRGTPGLRQVLHLHRHEQHDAEAPTSCRPGTNRTHDTVLLEWTAKDPAAATYDGGAPRELFRAAQPFRNHNGGQIAFNPLATPGSAGLRPALRRLRRRRQRRRPAQPRAEPGSAFGKILRIDPLGRNSTNGKYGIPASNPFVRPKAGRARRDLRLRRPQPAALLVGFEERHACIVADIGQNIVEEISPVTAGANLGWNKWEGSFSYVKRQGRLDQAAQRARHDVASRRVRPPRSAASARGRSPACSSTARARSASCRT